MNRTVVLLRHGRTAWNHAGRVQGQADAELDDVGREQAARVAPAMAALEPTVLWSSDLLRAAVTADAVASATGLTPSRDPRLREFALGIREGLTHEEYVAAAPEEFARFREGYYDEVPEAEHTLAVAARMSAVVHDLLDALGEGQTGVAVSHGAAIRVATGTLLGWPEDQYRSLRGLENCAWVVLVEHPDTGSLRLGAYNRTVLPGAP